jgi:spore coat-associated protein N
MSIKKKLGLGLASAALGLSLVGGGTFAYFSDNASIHNSFTAGTLDLDVGSYQDGVWPVNFDIKDIRPGDTYERTFVLNNNGSLAIGDTYLDFSKVNVSDPLGAGGTEDAFLDSLVVDYFVEAGGEYLLLNSQDITLKEAIAGDFTGKIESKFLTTDGKLNLTPDGIAAGDEIRFRIWVTFAETGAEQNEFQGMGAKVDFNLDARQVMGDTYQHPQGPNNDNQVDPDVTDTGVND